jgi:hypothetical protein
MSNVATISWGAGAHSTFIDLNLAPTTGNLGVSMVLTASLYDESLSPPSPVSGRSVQFSLGGQTCNAATNGAGVATCSLSPAMVGLLPLSVTFAGDGTYAAATTTQAIVIIGAMTLDVDLNGQYDALTDGLLLVRHMFGLTSNSLIAGAVSPNAQRASAALIQAYVHGLGLVLDIDGNGHVDALTDGLLTIRYLFGLRGAALIQGAISPGATRTTSAAVEAYIQSLMP